MPIESRMPQTDGLLAMYVLFSVDVVSCKHGNRF